MGLAGDSLARILKTFVELSIPRIRLIEVKDVNTEIEKLVGEKAIVTGVRQAFFSYWRGEAITIYDQNGCNELASLMGYSDDMDKNAEVELLLDVGNVIVGACINGFAEQLDVEVNFGPPSVIATNIPVEQLFNPKKLTWSHSLLLEVNFGLENMRFKSHLMVMMSEETIETLKKDLDAFLEGL
jgi:chemotaxis protein CheC